MGYNIKPLSRSNKKHENGAKNGLIPSATKLSYAIHYFAGGFSYDIAIAHGIIVTSFYKCVDR